MMGTGPVISGSVARQLEENTGTSESLLPTATVTKKIAKTAPNDSSSLKR